MDFLLWVLCFTMIATAMGQVAGALGARRGLIQGGCGESDYQLMPWTRFQIRHLLWVTFWFGLLLSAMRGLGLLTGSFLALLGLWSVMQIGTLASILRLLKWRAAKRSRVEAASRST